MKITIETIPHKDQRYDTVGDYVENGDTLEMKISDLGDWRMEFLIAIHELIEWGLSKDRGITIEQIDSFDIGYNGDYDEPGDDPASPYNREHEFATMIEKIVCHKFKIKWEDYEKVIEGLE